MRRVRRQQPTIKFDGRQYKVRGKVPIPDFSVMDRFSILMWLNRHTYATGGRREQDYGLAGAVKLIADK